MSTIETLEDNKADMFSLFSLLIDLYTSGLNNPNPAFINWLSIIIYHQNITNIWHDQVVLNFILTSEIAAKHLIKAV